MNTNIKRLCENAEIMECGVTVGTQVILVVNEKRQFLGTVQPAELESSIAGLRKLVERPSVFSGLLSGHVPAAVEIPAFEWLK